MHRFGEGRLVKLATRLIVEEALEGEAGDAVGRDYYEHGAQPGQGYRNGYREARLKTAEGLMEYSAPQIAGRDEPFRSAIREHLRGHTQDLEDLVILRFPVTHRRAIRTTNLLARLFVEERRRLKIIPNAFGERAVVKLMFGALIRAAERWRSVKVTEFEHRQITAVRKELDQEYEAQAGPKTQPSKEAPSAKISSKNRTWPS